MIISLAVGILIGLLTSRDLGVTWGIVCGVGAFLISQVIIMLILRKKINRIQLGMQQTMQAAQARIARQVQNFQQRPVGSPKMMQQKLESMQNDALHEALRMTTAFDPFYRWNWMLAKQINTMKMQLYFQLKDYAAVDKLLPKCLLFDARSLAIKLVRMYKKEDPKLDTFYRKKCRRLMLRLRRGRSVRIRFWCKKSSKKLKHIRPNIRRPCSLTAVAIFCCAATFPALTR